MTNVQKTEEMVSKRIKDFLLGKTNTLNEKTDEWEGKRETEVERITNKINDISAQKEEDEAKLERKQDA